ncbi:Pleiotropic drug resistance protein 1 [Linum grandiflorum]
MEGGDLYKARNSIRRSGSASIWRNNPSDAFSASSRGGEEDDEEALKWAALERLPTYDRLRKGILASASKAQLSEIDIHNLGPQERKLLLDRLVDQDYEKFLLKLKNRVDRVGVELPTIEVRYENLNVEAEATVGSKALPTFINFTIAIFETVLNAFHLLPKNKRHLTILNDVSGIIKPSRLTLLLGPPSSGKTSLLLALAGRLDPNLKVSGRVTYNGHEMNEFIPQKTSAYISQHDLHMGELTVRETFAFAARVQGVGSFHDMLAELSRREKAANIKPDPDIDVFMKAAATEGLESNVVTDYVLKMLGLEGCADTLVGDEMIRGISGGQRKRVTTGEMLVGPSRALFMDEISTGLDSSTTFQIVNSLKQSIQILNGTCVISLLQPAPETYDLFDDIILLSDGQVVYQGPRENVLEFFEHMGFKCPDRKGVADFLQEVTSKKDQKQYWTRRDQPYRFVTVKEFSEAFQSFHVGRRTGDELSVAYDKTKSHPAALATKKYGVGTKELLKANFSREYLLMKRNSFVYVFKLTQLFIMALVTMTIFFRTEMHRNTEEDGGMYVGALFFTLVMIMFNGMSELSMTIAKLPVFYKQRNLFFYPPWVYSIPPWVLKIPVTFVEVAVWVFITYYVIGFDSDFGRLVRQYVLLVAINQMASALFRAIGAFGRHMIVANTFGSFALLLLFALSGFVLSREDVKKWWIWAYWASPMMYGQNAIVVNEFLGNSWSHIPPNRNESLGLLVLKSRGFFTEPHWYWLGVGASIGFLFLFNIMFSMALTFMDEYDKPKAVISEDSDEATKSARNIEMTRAGVVGDSVSENDDHESKKKGMALPFEPHSITFDNIIYSVDMPQEMKSQGVDEDRLVLLKGVSGAFRPGVLTALMGVSGAGKTTLMDVLAGRKTGGYIEGDISISGYPKKQSTFARISGYCEQNDIHSPQVTVYESLVYSAWLRLPQQVDQKTRMMFVEQVMELVELNPLRNSLVGLPGVNGLSTEQRKRLTIAVELVANPSIIFMDEPTSGLDARAAAIVMRTVRNTVDTGRTVVCTIHQPSIDIFEAFDELLLLKRGGQEIYVGPLGRHSIHLVNYFEEIDGVSKIKDGYNPATWMLEVTTTAQEVAMGVDFTEIYRNSDLYKRNKALITDLSKASPGSKELYFETQYSQSFFTQCMACLWKQHWSYWRNPPYTGIRFWFTTFIGLMFGTIFWDLGGKTSKQQDLFNALGSLFASVLFIGVQNASAVQPVAAIERTVFYRERAAGMYSAMPYAYAQVLIELPYVFAQSVMYGVITYSMIGFEWEVQKFLWYIFFVYFTLLYFTFYGLMSVAITPNHHIAAIISSFFYSFWIIFSGFMIPRPRIPIWWRWYYWADPISWTLYGLLASQFGDVKTKMDSGVTVQDFLKSYFGFEHDFLGVVAAVMVGLAVGFAFIFAISIKSFNFQRR